MLKMRVAVFLSQHNVIWEVFIMRKIGNRIYAMAHIRGGSEYPRLSGTACFKQTDAVVLVTVRVNRLPRNTVCDEGIFAIHIHDGDSCTGTRDDKFGNAESHYNPQGCEHPYHAGDLPPLFGNNSLAYMSVQTNRFTVNKIIDKVIIIHGGKDDFTTQPSGNAGTKIAR